MTAGALAIVLFISWLLYREGFGGWIIKKCPINEDKPRKEKKKKIRKAKPQKAVYYQAQAVQPQTVIIYENRTQLESRCANILTARRYRGDAWGLVRTLTNQELYQILQDGF